MRINLILIEIFFVNYRFGTSIGTNFVLYFVQEKNELMIKKLFVFSLVLLVSILVNSCDNKSNINNFDITLLYGKWVEGDLYYKYEQNGTGISWDESERYYEEDGLPFTWSLAGSRLSHIHTGSIDGGGGITAREVFTVTELTTARMRFIDEDNKNRIFRKVFD